MAATINTLAKELIERLNHLSRVINQNPAGKQRSQLCKAVGITLRELARKSAMDAEARDMAAFVALCLHGIHSTIDETVRAWEKRNYWIKADRFRHDWKWAQKKSEQVTQAVQRNDWTALAHIMPEIASQLKSVKLPKRNTIGSAWDGAYQHLQNSTRK